MVNACALGFSTENDGETNTTVLNRILCENDDVIVSFPGIYRLTGPVILNTGNHLKFGTGTTVVRERAADGDNGNLFINKGAFTAEYDEDISLEGLHLVTNGVERKDARDGGTRTITGLRGHVAFFYVKGLYVSDMLVTDLGACDYAIQISDFEDVTVENVQAEGMKDGIHFGPGKRFILKNCRFRTYDDDIALNCSDYSVSNPNIGSIEDGIIENIVDLPGQYTESMFLRILVGTPLTWHPGMTVYHSDAVINDGRMYRVVMNTDNVSYTSVTPPTHEDGFVTLDGIRWLRTNKGYSAEQLSVPAGCKNIVVKNAFLEQKRNIAVMIYTDYSEYLKSYHSGSPVPEVEGISFENVQVLKPVKHFMYIGTPVNDLQLSHCSLGDSDIEWEQNPRMAKYQAPEIGLYDTQAVIRQKNG